MYLCNVTLPDGAPSSGIARLLSMCVGTAFFEETDLETAEGIVQELLGDAEGQGIFGKEQREKLLISVREVYRLRDNSQKEIDAGTAGSEGLYLFAKFIPALC